MSMVLPASVPVEGTRRVVFIEGGVADLEAITLGEINSGENVSCYLTGTGWQPTRDQQVISDTRLCTTQDLQRPGRKSAGLTIQYTYNVNEPTDDEARLALTEGSEGVLVNIVQKPEDEDSIEVGDWYEAWPVVLGQQQVMPSEANAIDRIQQVAFVTGQVSPLSQVVAGS
jgi:hypothetical protein